MSRCLYPVAGYEVAHPASKRSIETGRMSRARDEGLARAERSDYVVRAADVVHFRFNV